MKKKAVIFDLDDTLYSELDFLKSAFYEISEKIAMFYGVKDCYNMMLKWYEDGVNVFDRLLGYCGNSLSKKELLFLYRNHKPCLKLDKEVEDTLSLLKKQGYMMGIITDGRSITQRNKIYALRLDKFFSENNIVISEEFGTEKPCIDNYQYFERKDDLESFCYVGDNVNKDFIAPKTLGWRTVCVLDSGNNIHSQNFNLPCNFLPEIKIMKFSDLLYHV